MINEIISFETDDIKPEYRDSVLDDLANNGTAVPAIKLVMFNTGIKRVFKTLHGQPVLDDNGHKILESTYPTLTTVIHFIDGSKTVVTNSVHDTVSATPSREDKERGIVYALAKRILASRYSNDADDNTVLESEGFGRILKDLVDNAYDCQLEAEKTKAAKKAAQAKHEADMKAAESKKPNPSLAQCVRDLKDTIDILRANLNSLKSAE